MYQGAKGLGKVTWWGLRGQNAGNVGGSPPDRVDQLFGFCTSFRPPVYSTPGERKKADTTLVGEVDMSLTQGVLILLLKVQQLGLAGSQQIQGKIQVLHQELGKL